MNRPGWAFFIFHLRVGTRLALRKLALVLAVVFATYYFFKPEFFYSVFAESVHTNFLFAGIFSAVVCLSIARISALRVCFGLDGWIRHLPSSSPMSRRLASLAIFVAQMPILIALAILAIYAGEIFEVSATAYLLGLPVLGLASSQAVMPVERKMITRPLAVAACLSSASGHWPLLMGGVILLVISDLISGPISSTRKRSKFHKAFKGSLLYATVAWRALQVRILIPYLLSLMVLGATVLFIFNNALHPSLAVRALCLGGGVSLVVFCAFLANILVARRPPWPWARSLPWSSRERITIDSFFLGVHNIPLLILVGMMSHVAVLSLVASLPLFTLYASQAMRRAPECRTGAAGKILGVGLLAALSISLIPWVALVFLALTPLALRYAAEEEKRQKVGRWLELHHLAAGDSLSWRK